jgi:hypothetical protein
MMMLMMMMMTTTTTMMMMMMIIIIIIIIIIIKSIPEPHQCETQKNFGTCRLIAKPSREFILATPKNAKQFALRSLSIFW